MHTHHYSYRASFSFGVNITLDRGYFGLRLTVPYRSFGFELMSNAVYKRAMR